MSGKFRDKDDTKWASNKKNQILNKNIREFSLNGGRGDDSSQDDSRLGERLVSELFFILFIKIIFEPFPYCDCFHALSDDSIRHGEPSSGHHNPVLEGSKCEEQLPNVEPRPVRSPFG